MRFEIIMSSLKIFLMLAAILVIVAVAGCTQKAQQATASENAAVQDLNNDVSSADAAQNEIAAPELNGLPEDMATLYNF